MAWPGRARVDGCSIDTRGQYHLPRDRYVQLYVRMKEKDKGAKKQGKEMEEKERKVWRLPFKLYGYTFYIRKVYDNLYGKYK